METVACHLCGSARSREEFHQRDLTHGVSGEEFCVVRCEDCDLRYVNPRPTQAEIGRHYPEAYFDTSPRRRPVSRVKRWVMEDYYGYPQASSSRAGMGIRKWALWPEKCLRVLRGRDILPWRGRGRLLDVGCGSGVNLASLLDQGWDVYGLDNSRVAVDAARKSFGDRVRLGELHQAPFDDGFFDVVLFSHTLEHLYDPLAVLTEARRILADDGMVVITLPNAAGWEARLFGRWWFPWELPRHLYHFERATLGRFLARAGFRGVRWRTGVGSLFFMSSLDRVWRRNCRGSVPVRKFVEKLIARPFCLVAGHLGHGTELTVYAVKEPSGPAGPA